MDADTMDADTMDGAHQSLLAHVLAFYQVL
jgi:hypothetical protein